MDDSYYTDPSPPDPSPGYYRHVKGDWYQVEPRSVQRHATTRVWEVRYRSVRWDRYNPRPYEEFMGDRQGQVRFQFMGTDPSIMDMTSGG